MENDWLNDNSFTQPLYSDFIFGERTINDIIDKYGSSGYVYKNRQFSVVEDSFILFNCYEFDSPYNEVLVVITAISVNLEGVDNEERAIDHAIIIADKEYLDSIWGKEKKFAYNYKK